MSQMPKEAEAWEAEVLTGQLYKPPVGKFIVKITGPVTIVAGYAGRPTKEIPTDQGPWRTTSFAVLRAIKLAKKELGDYIGHKFTFEAQGEQLQRRYVFVEVK